MPTRRGGSIWPQPGLSTAAFGVALQRLLLLLDPACAFTLPSGSGHEFRSVAAGATCRDGDALCERITTAEACHAAVKALLPTDPDGLAADVSRADRPGGCYAFGNGHGYFNDRPETQTRCSDVDCLCQCTSDGESDFVASSNWTTTPSGRGRFLPPPPPCSTDMHCSLNGVCSSSGSCDCRPGWMGADCGQLDFKAAPVGQKAFWRNTTASWGGSIIQAEGRWHLFLAYIEGNCGLSAWIPNSAIYRAVANSPMGPFEQEEKVLQDFAHSPQITRAEDGTYLVWHIGDAAGPQKDGFNPNCTNGTTPTKAAADFAALRRASPSWPLPSKQVNVATSRSVRGPWIDTGLFDVAHGPPIFRFDNPSPIHFKNGTTWVMGRSWNKNSTTQTFNSTTGIARSDQKSWNSTYTTRQEAIPQFVNFSVRVPPEAKPVQLEDAFFWLHDEGGDHQSFHALFHSMGGCKQVGCHAFSADGYTWRMSSSALPNAYNSSLPMSDGTSKSLVRRERPHLVFNSRGDPAFLSSACQESWDSDHTYTHVQPLNVEWP